MIPRKHIKGIKHLYNNEFDKAYNDFEKSYKFFDKYKFIDEFGFIFLLSMSDYTYRESALLNQAFICNKIGNKEEAEKLYEKILSINPKNRIARKVIESKK